MKRLLLALCSILIITSITQAQTGVSPLTIPSISGYWTFDDTTNVVDATFGTDLLPVGYISSVKGPAAADYAVRLGNASYFKCFHNIAPNGSGTPAQVNQYSLLIDFKINQFGMWRSFFQTDPANTSSDDGEVFINPSGNIGVSATGYSSRVLEVGEWYRLVISVNLGSYFNYYLDGALLFNGTSQVADGRFSLNPSTLFNNFLLFADNDNEDNVIDIAQVAVFSSALSASDANSLGGFGHIGTTTHKGINAYLQTPTPTSVYVSWHSTQTSSTLVQYATTPLVNFTALGSYEVIDTKNWHTVKLTGLMPDTHYYYRCISGTDTSQVYEFRSSYNQISPGKHIRFILIADSQSDVNMPTHVSNAIEDKLKELYGVHWVDSVNLIIRPGDMVGNGNDATAFEREYFNPFGNLTRSIPSMISIGNHESESAYYYQYVKYEDVSDYSYPNSLAERYYSFNMANCQFIAINSNTIHQNTAQTTWLHNKLEQSNVDPATDFVFTYNHHPGHSEMWPDGNTSYSLNNIYGELVQYPKVVFNAYGHSHNYEHGVKKSTHNQAQDFHLLCVGGAGAYLDRWGEYINQTDYPEIQSMYDYYSYVIFDIDAYNKSYTATTYTLGNPDKRLNNILLESWHYRANQPAPQKPLALAPTSVASVTPTLTASPFNGLDEVMSSQFQVSTTPGVWTSPLLDSLRDFTDIYGNSGAPNYIPTDLMQGVDLKRLQIPSGMLAVGNTYAWRVRYRDKNIKWSDWSDQAVFTVILSVNDSAAFVADTTTGLPPLTVHFTDLSTGSPTAWEWDFDNDGTVESTLQDPVYVYDTPGLYSVKLVTYYGTLSQTTIESNYINILITGTTNSEIVTYKCYPNPFTDKIVFQINGLYGNSEVALDIFDCRGRLLENVVKGRLNAGESVVWYAQKYSAGIYYARITSGKTNQTIKLVKTL